MTATFKFKWAYMTASDTTMQYTSSVNIPVWNYTKLQKITVYGGFLNNTIILFDKTRTANPVISSETPTLNLHNELVEYEKIRFVLNGKRYGDPYTMLFYVDVDKVNDKFETSWRVGDRTYYVEYTYDVLGYDISSYRTNNVPLQLIFKEYNFSTTDIQLYKSMEYTASEMKAAGIKFSVLLGGGYSMDELFSALWSFHTNNQNDYIDNPNDFINYFNSMKTGNPTITAENVLLKTENASLNTENVLLNTENASLKSENILLKNNIESLESEITLLKTETSNNTTNIATQCSIQICKWETLSKT